MHSSCFHKMLDTQRKFPSAQEMIKISGPEIKRLEDKLLWQTVGSVYGSQGLVMVKKNQGPSVCNPIFRDSANNRLHNLYYRYKTTFSIFRTQNYRNDKQSSEGKDRLKRA